VNGFISLQSGAQIVQQGCHKISLIFSIDLVVVGSLWVWVCLFASRFLYYCWPYVLETSNHYLWDILQLKM